MTLAEIAAELEIPAETLAAKPDVVKKYDGLFAASDTAVAEAQRKLAEATALDRVVNENIASFGLTEANVEQLKASNAALTAALESVKKAGFSGITIPDLPPLGKKPTDPMDDLKSLIVSGFTNVGQTLNVQNKYQRVFGRPMPDDPATLADEAAKMRMPVAQYAEQKYGFAKATAKQEAEWKAKGAEEWKAAHPAPTFGEGGGLPSNHAQMPKPRDAGSVREFAGMTAREKITSAMKRANEAAKSMSAA